ncbi:MAG TPA: glycosyltransferase family 4 protein [Thermoplasmata archaeon]|nr:glycosyltransferase family 4 protein [Thermoplasmata archaeon]
MVLVRLLYFAHYAGGTDAASAMDEDLFASLRHAGHEVVVLSPFRNPSAGRAGGSVAVGRLPRFLLSVPGYGGAMLRGLRLAKGGVRIAAQYLTFTPAAGVGFLVARITGRPLLARAHDLIPGSYRSPVEGALNRILFRAYRRVLRHPATWIFVPSAELRDIAIRELGLPRERLLVLPNNVTPFPAVEAGLLNRLRTTYGLATSRVVLQFGSFTREGIGTLVRALRMVARPDVHGVVLTDPDRGALFREAAAREGVADRFVILPTQSREIVAAFVAMADVCVGLLSAHAIANGAVPRSSLEAMAAGKPVVLSRGLVSPSLAEGEATCLLIPPDDPQALGDAIVRVLDDRGFAAALGARARERVRETFGSDVVAKDFLSLVDGIA